MEAGSSSSRTVQLSSGVSVVSDVYSIGPVKQSDDSNGWSRFLVAKEDYHPGDVLCTEARPFVTCERYQEGDDVALGLIIKAVAEAMHDGRKRATEDMMIWETLRTQPARSAAKDVRISHETSICVSNAIPLLADDPPPAGTDQRLQVFLESSCIECPPRSVAAASAPGPRVGHAADLFLYDDPHGVYLTLGLMPHSCAPNTAHRSVLSLMAYDLRPPLPQFDNSPSPLARPPTRPSYTASARTAHW